jgi:hypothetical protein
MPVAGHRPALLACSRRCLQVFQAYMLMLAERPEGSWPVAEELLALAQNAWVQSTKKIK